MEGFLSLSELRHSPESLSVVAAIDERVLKRFEREHADGLTAAQIVEIFTTQGVRLSEATFRKWVQLGLLPRSRRVGRKGKHQGSRGLYPASTLRRINRIKRLMAESLTIEEIGQSLQFRDQIESLIGGLETLLGSLGAAIADLKQGDRTALERQLGTVRREAGDWIGRLEALERRLITPLERAARQRAFGAGSAGGASDLL